MKCRPDHWVPTIYRPILFMNLLGLPRYRYIKQLSMLLHCYSKMSKFLSSTLVGDKAAPSSSSERCCQLGAVWPHGLSCVNKVRVVVGTSTWEKGRFSEGVVLIMRCSCCCYAVKAAMEVKLQNLNDDAPLGPTQRAFRLGNPRPEWYSGGSWSSQWPIPFRKPFL